MDVEMWKLVLVNAPNYFGFMVLSIMLYRLLVICMTDDD